MRDLDFSQDGMTIISKDYASHRIEKHLEHCLRTKTRPYNVGDPALEFSFGLEQFSKIRLTSSPR
jgi:hypothetical protein